MVDRDELSGLLYELFFFPEKAPPLKKIKRWMKEAGPQFERDPGKFLESVYKIVPLPLPKPTAIGGETKVLLGEFLKEVYEWCKLTGYRFEDCKEPSKVWGFCEPWDGHWEQTYDQLNEKQRGLFGVLRRHYQNKRYGDGQSSS